MKETKIYLNWKCNSVDTDKYFEEIFKGIPKDAENITFFVPSIKIFQVMETLKGTSFTVGAQNCIETEGAFTGEISLNMLQDYNIKKCIIGHSERRWIYGEKNSDVNKKVYACLEGGVVPVLCIGERIEERTSNKHKRFVQKQILKALNGLTALQVQQVVFAYEPVWAIGTGLTATPEQAQDMCNFIRSVVKNKFGEDTANKISILYGGSVNPGNIKDIVTMEDIDGVLVGGAGLNPQKVIEMYNICNK